MTLVGSRPRAHDPSVKAALNAYNILILLNKLQFAACSAIVL